MELLLVACDWLLFRRFGLSGFLSEGAKFWYLTRQSSAKFVEIRQSRSGRTVCPILTSWMPTFYTSKVKSEAAELSGHMLRRGLAQVAGQSHLLSP